MSEIMTAIPFGKMVEWMTGEYKKSSSIFGIRAEKFYKNATGTGINVFGEAISSPIGPAAGPNSQLAQNIVASYLAGSRFIELKTVQKMDGEALRNCVARPCINAEDECYNVEWSTELTVEQAFDEYVKGFFAIQVMAKELGLADSKDFCYSMSVGYDLEGIQTAKIDNFIEGMKDAKDTKIWKECRSYLLANLSLFKHVTKEFVEGIGSCVCPQITLSTLHGCPPQEIERIATYLLTEKKIHTYIKCNPTMLGYEFARDILDDMGYGYISFDDHHFNNDLQYKDAIPMFNRLIELAKEKQLSFGLKITNTFPVQVKNNELPGEEMYMSGRSLYPLSISLANKLSQEYKGKLPISYSGGADCFNIEELIKTGIQPITVATTILKPGGYERLKQLADIVEPHLKGHNPGIDVEALNKLALEARTNPHHIKSARTVGSRKTKSELLLFDCAKAPCKDGGCPIEQQIPEYLKLVADGKYEEAFKIISIDNANPGITGTLCNHACQTKCTRLDYEASLEIRNMKKIAVLNAQDKFIDAMKASDIKTEKTVAIVGAGPAGVSAGLFLRRNGVKVTVLEKRERAFGIVEYVIPEFRISKDMIQRDFRLAEKAGIEFKFGIDENCDIAELKKNYDFVVLATGAWREGASPVKEGADKLRDALEFLETSKKNDCQVDLGKRVAVIGGGDVAMDCARAAKHSNTTEEVCIVYRRTREFMPAEHEEIELAIEDGVKFMELLGPVQYDGKSLRCEVMALGERDSSGRKGVIGTGEIKELAFDTVISAVGARVDTSIFTKNGIGLNERGAVKINSGNETNVENVYVAGDCKAGASTIVKAIADGKKIAMDILAKLALQNDFVRVSVPQAEETLYYKKGILWESTKEAADGNRCLACDQICELCVDVCPNRANVRILVDPDHFRDSHQILHIDGMCNECGNCAVFCPHAGKPYKDKTTLFWSEEDFNDSENKGFLKLSEDRFMVRNEKGEILTHVLGDGKVSKEFESVIQTVLKEVYC